MPPKVPSKVWHYFDKVYKVTDDGDKKLYARCNVEQCGKEYVILGGSTSNLMAHLQRGHSSHPALHSSATSGHSVTRKPRSTTVKSDWLQDKRRKAGFVTAAKGMPMNMKQRQTNFHMEVVRFLVSGHHSFSMADSQHFQSFVAAMDASLKLGSAAAYESDTLPMVGLKVRQAVQELLKRQLQHVSGLTLSAQICCHSDHHFLLLAIHFIDHKFILNKYILDCLAFDSRPPVMAQTMNTSLDKVVQDVPSLRYVSEVTLVHDSCLRWTKEEEEESNKKGRPYITTRLECAARTLDATVMAALSHADCAAVKQAVGRAGHLCGACHRSPLCWIAIRHHIHKVNHHSEEDPVEPEQKLVMPVSGQGSSIAAMLQSILKLRRPLELLRDQPDYDPAKLSDLVPSNQDLDLYQAILPSLNRLAQTCSVFREDDVPTVHVVVREIFMMRGFIESAIKDLDGGSHPAAHTFLILLLEHIDRQLPANGTHILHYAVGNLLHPLYRGEPLKLFGGFEAAYEALIMKSKAYSVWLQASQHCLPDSNADGQDEDTGDDELLALTRISYQKRDSGTRDKAPIVAEWEAYLASPRMSSNKYYGNEVLKFWRENSSQFPLLAAEARRWLCIPAAASSALHSDPAQSSENCQVQAENVDKLLYIQQNMSKLSKSWSCIMSSEEPDVDEAEDEEEMDEELPPQPSSRPTASRRSFFSTRSTTGAN